MEFLSIYFGSDSVVCQTLRNLTLWGVEYHRSLAGFFCFNFAESWTMRSLTLRCVKHRGVWLRGVSNSAESDSAVCQRLQSFWKVLIRLWKTKYFSKIFKHETQGPSWVWLIKKPWSKISWHCPFKFKTTENSLFRQLGNIDKNWYFLGSTFYNIVEKIFCS